MKRPSYVNSYMRGDSHTGKMKEHVVAYIKKLESAVLPGVKLEVSAAVAARLDHARKKHPDSTRSESSSKEAIADEYMELEQAWDNESPTRQKDETLDVIATCVRDLNREWV